VGRKRGSAGRERVLALDTSSTCVGFAIFDNGELVRHGKYIQKGADHCEKLHNFHAWVMSMLRQFEPDVMVYEKPFAGRRRYAFSVLLMYVAVVLMAHWAHFGAELPDSSAIAAREVKRRNKMKKGKDHASNKKLAVLLANQLYKLRLKYKANDKTKAVSQDDQADAILLGRAWLLTERPHFVEES
jgi:Holliday junction resolvasome RuvABC endonuclease subunit